MEDELPLAVGLQLVDVQYYDKAIKRITKLKAENQRLREALQSCDDATANVHLSDNEVVRAVIRICGKELGQQESG